jgi:hypothetical protein
MGSSEKASRQTERGVNTKKGGYQPQRAGPVATEGAGNMLQEATESPVNLGTRANRQERSEKGGRGRRDMDLAGHEGAGHGKRQGIPASPARKPGWAPWAARGRRQRRPGCRRPREGRARWARLPWETMAGPDRIRSAVGRLVSAAFWLSPLNTKEQDKSGNRMSSLDLLPVGVVRPLTANQTPALVLGIGPPFY